MKHGIGYAALVICCVAAFLSAVCLANGKAIAVLPLVVNITLVVILSRVVDRYERGGRF